MAVKISTEEKEILILYNIMRVVFFFYNIIFMIIIIIVNIIIHYEQGDTGERKKKTKSVFCSIQIEDVDGL